MEKHLTGLENDNVVLISLGQNCQMQKHIHRITGKSNTNIFDNIGVNFESVINILRVEKFVQNDFVNHSVNYDSKYHWKYRCNGENVPINKNWIKNKELIECKNFILISVHYIDKGEYNNKINDFVDMMNRRLNRLKNTIQKNEHIDFFYCANAQFTPHHIPSIENLKEFDYMLKTINPKTKYKLNILIHPEHHQEIDGVEYNLKNVNVCKLEYKDNTKHERLDFMDDNLNWGETFSKIYGKI